MKLCILVESLLVKDEDKIVLYRHNILDGVSPFTCGTWYQDNILDHMQDEIVSMKWSGDTRVWKVVIKGGAANEDQRLYAVPQDLS